MSKLFIDTSGWANLFVSSEIYHSQAQQHFLKTLQSKQAIVTTNYIIAELVALLQSPLRISRNTIFQVVDSIRQSEHVQVIHIDIEIDTAAWQLCKARSDKTWSLVDCTSFVIDHAAAIHSASPND